MHTLEQIRSGELAGIQWLNLSSSGLTGFPSEIYDLADSLEVLDLGRNMLTSLPDDLPRLHRLKVIFCSDNLFSELPEVLGQCLNLSMVGFKACRIRTVSPKALPPGLRWLILTDNQVETLPEEIGRCTGLQKLMLAGNRLKWLPESMTNCTNLELLRIAANQFDALPDWILTLPRLSWLAYAGNPFCQAWEQDALGAGHEPIHWANLRLGAVLGQGASGVIYRATHDGDGPSDVAVKLFKGAVTSDGLPQSEMAACLAAGAHPNLIPVVGRLDGHPDGTEGLVMALVDTGYGNLAGPPSLESCTRDIFADSLKFDLRDALRVIRDMASIGRQLHDHGILHGDLYAHNILYGGNGRVLFGDFGAACLYDRADQGVAGILQRFEVRALGCLIEELTDRLMASEDRSVVDALMALKAECLSEDIMVRPLFAQIEARLSTL